MSRFDVTGVGAASGGEQTIPTLYTFDCRRSDGSPVCLEAHEFRSDQRALDHAQKLLAEHLTCSTIEVFEGARLVGTAARELALEDDAQAQGLQPVAHTSTTNMR